MKNPFWAQKKTAGRKAFLKTRVMRERKDLYILLNLVGPAPYIDLICPRVSFQIHALQVTTAFADDNAAHLCQLPIRKVACPSRCSRNARDCGLAAVSAKLALLALGRSVALLGATCLAPLGTMARLRGHCPRGRQQQEWQPSLPPPGPSEPARLGLWQQRPLGRLRANGPALYQQHDLRQPSSFLP